MRRTMPLLFAAWLLFAQPPKPPDAAPARPSGSIHGVVKDAVTGAPLPDFNILAVPSRSAAADTRVGPRMTAVTDSEGRYVYSKIPPGSYRVSVQLSRRPVMSQSIQLSAGQDVSLDFLIPASPAISGLVLDQDKQPVVDAFVWVVQAEYRYASLRHTLIGPKITGEDGAFSFDSGLDAGRAYYVVADRPPPDEVVTGEPAPL